MPESSLGAAQIQPWSCSIPCSRIRSVTPSTPNRQPLLANPMKLCVFFADPSDLTALTRWHAVLQAIVTLDPQAQVPAAAASVDLPATPDPAPSPPAADSAPNPCAHRSFAVQHAILIGGDAACLPRVLPQASASGQRPVSWLAPREAARSLLDPASLLQGGLTGWWPVDTAAAPDAELLQAWLATDRARWLQQQSLHAALLRAQDQLDDRKWIERAKGLVMTLNELGEDEAFKLLRAASMQANMRLAELSRSLVVGAGWAEAINRAGQLRMLSQRVIKLAAQRLAQIEPRRAKTAQDEALARAQIKLRDLQAWLALRNLPTADLQQVQPAMQACSEAWQQLAEALAAKLSLSSLLSADACADRALDAAEHLVQALDAASQRRSLSLINACGRQRMRSQRLAKLALLQHLRKAERSAPCGSPGGALLLDDQRAFEATHAQLADTPLSSSEIRQALAAARRSWQLMLSGLTSSAPHDEPTLALICTASDTLLERYDRLTQSLEHSLQVILA